MLHFLPGYTIISKIFFSCCQGTYQSFIRDPPAAPKEPMSVPKAKILVIDDEQGIRELLVSELVRQGYAAESVRDGEEALGRLTQDKYDLVITDIKMPRVDGLQVLSAVKKASPETEVIIVTGYATVESAVQAMKDGAYYFIQKPFNLDELSVLIEKALEKSELKTLIALYESSKAIFSSLKLEELFPVMISLLRKVVRADEIALLLVDNMEQYYLAAASFPLVSHPYGADFMSLAERIHSPRQEADAPVIIRSPVAENPLMRNLFRAADLKSLVAYPLSLKSRNVGTLIVARTLNHSDFSSTDIRNLSIFVSQITQAIVNTKLYEKLEIKISELENAQRQLEHARRQLVLAEKMSTVGRMASGIVQRLSDPVNVMEGHLETLGTVSGCAAEGLSALKEDVSRFRAIINNLLSFAATEGAPSAECDVNQLISGIPAPVEDDFRNNGIEFARNLSNSIPKIKGDGSLLQQAVVNMLINARQSFSDCAEAAGRQKKVTVSTSFSDGEVHIEVNDNGCGIEDAIIDKIFEPFFTTKNTERHIGIGLSIAYIIVERHKGNIRVSSTPKEGTSFIIDLPVR